MDKNTLIEKEKEIYTKYQTIILPYIMTLEVRDVEYPIEIMNEIRAILTHLARFKLQDSEEDLIAADNHVKRAILDCYKYLCISMMEYILRFRDDYRKVDLKLADNGKFLPRLNQLEKEAQEAFKTAKYSEIAKVATDDQYVLFEKAYIAYSIASEHIDASQEAILFASSHSKRSNGITIVSSIITIISIIVAVVLAI